MMSTAFRNACSRDSEPCPICGKCDSIPLREVYDDRYGQPDRFTLVVCRCCGHCMTTPRLRESELGALYGTYYTRKYANPEAIRREAQRAVKRFARLRRWWMGTDNQGQYCVRSHESMLDIGCGSGLSLLEAKALGARACGVEADPNVRRLADDLGLQIYIGSMCDDAFPGQQFDLITLNQVIEHVPNPDDLLTRLRNRVRLGGRVVLVFPNARSIWCRLFGVRWINWHVPYHLHHFTRKGFEQLVQRCGYEVQGARSVTPNLWTLQQIRALNHDTTRGVPSPLWRVIPAPDPGTGETTSADSMNWVRRVVYLALMVPIGVVNRVVDALGWGDSLMVEIVPREST